MKTKDIIIGTFYRNKNSRDSFGNFYSYAKVLKILKPKQEENTTRKMLVKCEWVINKNDSFGLIKYFKISDLIKEAINDRD